MGTDVYLRWKGITKDEKEKQCTVSCVAGNDGYLRASIGMLRENRILQAIFVDYWEGENKTPYNFKVNYEKMLRLAMPYFLNCLTGKEFEIPEELQSQVRMGEAILTALKKAGLDEGDIAASGNNQRHPLDELAFGILWFNSLINFFHLGLEKQEEGKRPYLYINW